MGKCYMKNKQSGKCVDCGYAKSSGKYWVTNVRGKRSKFLKKNWSPHKNKKGRKYGRKSYGRKSYKRRYKKRYSRY